MFLVTYGGKNTNGLRITFMVNIIGMWTQNVSSHIRRVPIIRFAYNLYGLYYRYVDTECF